MLEVLTNRDAIAINQAYTTNAGDRIFQSGNSEVAGMRAVCICVVAILILARMSLCLFHFVSNHVVCSTMKWCI